LENKIHSSYISIQWRMKDPNWLLQSVAAVTKERYGAPKVLYQP
jgi:hypothetical protein